MAGGYLNVPTDAERNFQQRSVDSKGRAGPTLQRIADLHKTHKNNTGMLESLFEALAPLGMYSGEAEGAYIPSSRMKSAQGLAKVFQDWYKGGTPTINVPFERWGDIIRSGKFKNQMELAGIDIPEAWNQRIKVEKELGGYPYPKTTEKIKHSQQDIFDFIEKRKADIENIKKINKYLDPIYSLTQLNKFLKDIKESKQINLDDFIHKPQFSESLAKQNPIYGHIYNPKYTHPHTAGGFGDTYAEMSNLVKDQSKYVLGDSFNPFMKKAFSSEDMLGNTSRLERALFSHPSDEWKLQQITNKPQNAAEFMEMWIPNHLARLNNIKSVHVPGRAIGDSIDRAIPVRKVPELTKKVGDGDFIKPEDMMDKGGFEHEPFADFPLHDKGPLDDFFF